jgi:cell division protein FtsI/penicillin-binding protein 2
MRKAKVYSPMLPSVFLSQLNKLEFAAFQEKIRRFSGFYIQKRSLRDYQVSYGANVFGFITQVNENIVKKNPYYVGGDLIGRQGIEESYETFLRGQKGVKYILKDKFNREIASYKEGKYDKMNDDEYQLFNKEFKTNAYFKDKYNPNVFTSTITPGTYHIKDRNEPINSLMGISHEQQFQPSNYDIIEPFETLNMSNTYDPRFNGYGTSYRSYIDENVGQPRFYYDDVNAIKMPNYITRNAIDVTTFGDSYGPLNSGNKYTQNINRLADEDFTDSTINFRTEMMDRLMRKRNAEAWQQRTFPIRTGGQRMLK